MFCPTAVGTRGKGGILFPKRIPPLEPPEKGDGCSPRPPTLSVWCLNNYTRCALHSRWQLCCLTDVAYPLRVIRCGVHGFAMNPCESLRLATAPYCREARVTFAWRRTACGMRHCFARRIDGCLGRRKLGCTTTRQAERHPQGVCRIRKASEPPTAAQQRIIGAETSRIAVPTRLCRAQASPFRRHRSHSSPRLPINPFLLGVQGGYSLSSEREYPPFSHPARYGVPLYPLGQNAKIEPTLR